MELVKLIVTFQISLAIFSRSNILVSESCCTILTAFGAQT